MSQAFSTIKKKLKKKKYQKVNLPTLKLKPKSWDVDRGAIFKKYRGLDMLMEEGSQRLITKGRKIE